MRKLFKERKLIKGGNYMRKYGMYFEIACALLELLLFNWSVNLKVSKFQKQIFLFSFEPKKERNYFLISALVSKKWVESKNEGFLSY